VTRNRALKQAVRERAARTGEKYSAARRALVEQPPVDPGFERQLRTLLDRGYADAAGVTRSQLADRIAPLAGRVPGDAGGRIPFVIAVSRDVVSAGDAIRRVERDGASAISVLDDDELARFMPIEGVELPDGPAYLLVDVDTGHETRNVRPDDALVSIRAAGRSPLTIEEGIAVVTHHPETIARNDGWSLLASRCGDRRVGALWISKGAPKLGWCWAGNPHTWLGSASCAARVGL
jgi:hypothetical protein